MRNLIAVNNDGSFYDVDYNDIVDMESEVFRNMFFNNSGELSCIPLLETLKYMYSSKYPNSIILKNLENINDEYNIHIMLNTYHLSDDMLPWRHNKLLSRLFNTPIYADNIFLVLSEHEVNNGIQDITEDAHLDFIDKFDEICNALILPHEEYLSKLNIFIDNDTVISLNGLDVEEFQNEYIGNKKECIFDTITDINSYTQIIENDKLMLIQSFNDGELFFKNKTILYS